MPSLTWIGKDAVLNHHLDVPYRVLEKKYDFGDGEPGNKIIHGDNLEALKSLLPEYEGRVKCIYIDPPYNTGNENWVYNDNVNSPKIKKWLGQVVGKESEDLTRHDKWLCMMYPRLKLLQKLLHVDGFIAISIDDNELYNLGNVLDEIFGSANRVACIPVLTEPSGGKSKEALRIGHEYICVYVKKEFKGLKYESKNVEGRVEHDEFGEFIRGRELSKWGSESLREDRPDMWYAIKAPDGTDVYPYRNDGKEGRWRWGRKKSKMIEILKNTQNALWEKRKYDNGVVVNGQTERWFPYEKIREKEKQFGWNTWLDTIGYNSIGTNELKQIFGEKIFDTPKPTTLIQWIVNLMDDEDGIVLDSFAGSGTTAHAVLNLNKLDGGNRKFILVEMENYAESITAERVRRVIKGYKSDVQNELYSKELTIKDIKRGSEIVKELDNVRDEHKKDYDKFESIIENKCLKLLGVKKGECEGTGGSFAYYELGPELLKDGFINEDVPEQTIREYLYYTETNHVLPQSNNGHPAHLGNFEGVAYYFLYNKDETTTLDATFLASISEKADRYVIYADNCIMPQKFLFDHDITFKKIPRDIRRF